MMKQATTMVMPTSTSSATSYCKSGSSSGAVREDYRAADNKDEIQNFLAKKGYQLEDDDEINNAMVAVVPDDEEARKHRFLQGQRSETKRLNFLLSLCIIITSIELAFAAAGVGDGDGIFVLVAYSAVGINSIGFAFLCLLSLTIYRLEQHFTVRVDDCTVLHKVTKRFCETSFRKTYHVLVQFRAGERRFLKIFSVSRSRYYYLQMGEPLEDVYCHKDNPKLVVYRPPERGVVCRRKIILADLISFGLHCMSLIVEFVHPQIDQENAWLTLYQTLGMMAFRFLYLFGIVISMARKEIKDYVQVEQLTAVRECQINVEYWLPTPVQIEQATAVTAVAAVPPPTEQESLPNAKPVAV